MKNFLMMDNEMLLDNSQFNTFEKIGTEGFTLYCYLLTQQGQKTYCQTTIKMINGFMDRENKNPKKLTYGTKKCKVGTMKSKNIILRYLNVLSSNNLIEFDNGINYGINDIITIKSKRIETTNFTSISEELFVDFIYRIGHIGWSLLYILTKLHNSDFGSISSEGFANPTEEYLKSIIKKDVKTIRAYLYLLQEEKLIKIEPQDPIWKGLNKYGVDFYEYLPNNYIVKNRLIGNKYNLQK